MELLFNDKCALEEAYWSSFVKFEPLQTDIELIIYNDLKGEKEIQLSWFYQVKESYLDKEKLLFKFINKEINRLFANKKEQYSRTNLRLDSISISRRFQRKLEWEIDFCLDKGVEHFVIEMVDWEPMYFSVWA